MLCFIVYFVFINRTVVEDTNKCENLAIGESVSIVQGLSKANTMTELLVRMRSIIVFYHNG